MHRCGPKSIDGGHDEERALLIGKVTLKAFADDRLGVIVGDYHLVAMFRKEKSAGRKEV